ncbi:MAG: alpha/beta hydrolase-fold protein [Gemmatimonadota bacterium]
MYVLHAVAIVSGLMQAPASHSAAPAPSGLRFEVVIPASLRSEALTGRVFIFLSHDSTPEPRLEAGGMVSIPFFGVDVEGLSVGMPAAVGRTAVGYPYRSIDQLPDGDYFVQALVSVYTRFARADGHTIWAHMDEWEGQQFNEAPGSLVSTVRRVHVTHHLAGPIRLSVSSVLPPVVVPPDDQYVKRVRIQSQILTKWWGHPIYLGAVVLLPKGFDEHPNTRYPSVWEQGHFTLRAPLGFTLDSTPETAEAREQRIERSEARGTGYEFAKSWLGDSFPRMVAIRILHPSPYYDDSYAVNSANNGPYGDAIMQELIPYLEKQYRLIQQPYARMLTGGSTGGWESLALQVYHPDFFGGTWTLYPDPVDFRNYELMNLYADSNAFTVRRNAWISQDVPSERRRDGQPVVMVRQENQLNNARGSRRRGGENFAIWEATYGPTDKDGYPAPIWNDTTGVIDHTVADYWREHYDIREYLERNWTTVGPSLVGKIHMYVGDMDNYYLNLAVYRLEEFLSKTTAPAYGGSFDYGRPLKQHGWQPMSNADLIRQMATQALKNQPAADATDWRY